MTAPPLTWLNTTGDHPHGAHTQTVQTSPGPTSAEPVALRKEGAE